MYCEKNDLVMDWNLKVEKGGSLSANYREALILKHLEIAVGPRRTDGQCPGNETALAALTYLNANTQPVIARELRERMRKKHGIQVIGPFAHFYVDGPFTPRVLFTRPVVDAAGNTFYPGMLYTYNNPEEFAQILPTPLITPDLYQAVLPLDDRRLTLTIEPVRKLDEIPTRIGPALLVDDGGLVPSQTSDTVAWYIRTLLLDEFRESGGEEKFYREIAGKLVELFQELGQKVRVLRDYLANREVGTDLSSSSYWNFDPNVTYTAIPDPLNSLLPNDQHTYIVKSPNNKFFFVAANEIVILKDQTNP